MDHIQSISKYSDMKLTNIEIIRGHEALQKIEERDDLGEKLVWPIVINMDELERAKNRYDKAYAKYVQDAVVRDDDGNPVYPDGVDPNQANVDPKFKDKQALVDNLNELAQKTVEVEIETVSRSDFKSIPSPKILRKLRFMIEEL